MKKCGLGALILLCGCGDRAASSTMARIHFAQDTGMLPLQATVVLRGCASQLAGVYTTSTIPLYTNDTGCELALRSFVYKNAMWVAENGQDFAGAGSAKFVSAAGTFYVSNPLNLPNPVSSNAAVQFTVQTVAMGGNRQILNMGLSVELPSSTGRRAGPFFEWVAAELIGVSPLGVPKFKLMLECSGTFVAKSPLVASTCAVGGTKQTLSQMAVRLVPDTFQNGSALSFAQAQALFGNRWPPTPSSALLVNAQVLLPQNGKKGGVVLELDAPNPVEGCRNYLLVMTRGTSTLSRWSFRAFNLDFASAAAVCL